MLPDLLVPLADHFQPFNLFRYLSFRTGGALMTALIISFLFGNRMIRWLKSLQGEGQPIRDDGPESHIVAKKGTPLGRFINSDCFWGIDIIMGAVFIDLSMACVICRHQFWCHWLF